MRAIGYRVVLEIDRAPEIDEAGVYIQEEYREMREAAAALGKLVCMGPQAFKGDDCYDPDVKVGQILCFRKYAGVCFRTKSGQFVRVMNDRDCFLEWEEGDEEIKNDTF